MYYANILLDLVQYQEHTTKCTWNHWTENPIYRNILVSDQSKGTFPRPVTIYIMCVTTELEGRIYETTNFILRFSTSLFADLNVQQSSLYINKGRRMPSGTVVLSRETWLDIPFIEASYVHIKLWIRIPC